jgi:DNA-binding NtrC family response regulator
MPASTAEIFVGNSPRAKQTLRLVEKIGRCRWPVLLLGETGTGKEVIAKTIHNVEPVGPFVTIDCSALVGPLMESELFGHAKGSFTGAMESKLGLIESANGGTVFLDEIGELPLEMQSKLLRVLQQKEFRPVGMNQTRKVDFRVIAATNRDLSKEVDRGTFRRDLFYRLNVVTLRLAPLRDRQEDVPALVAHFLSKYGDNHEVSAETLDLLMEYGWPGNIRELENTVQHMVAICNDKILYINDLPSPIQNFARQREFQATENPALTLTAVPRAEKRRQILPLEEVEKLAILEALDFTRGDRSIAANMLGIGRTTLYRKLSAYQEANDERFRPYYTRELVAVDEAAKVDFAVTKAATM